MTRWRVRGALACVSSSVYPLRCDEPHLEGQRNRLEVFATYNVLSSHLSPPNKYRRCDPADLHPPTRLVRIQGKLEALLARRAVIGLQEVSTHWAGELHVFFARHGYQTVFAQGAESFNGRMGVLLAYPCDRFVAEKVLLHHVGESLPETHLSAQPVPHGLSEFGILSHEGLAEILGISPENLNRKARHAPRGPTVDVLNPRQDREWSLATRRQNMAVLARLRPTDGAAPVAVGVYHMPCLFGSVEHRQVVNIHAMALRNALVDLAAGSHVVLLGDFNLKPGSSSYDLISGGPLGHEDCPATRLYQRVYEMFPLRSAYAAAHGSEPHAHTLDYIWVSQGCSVKHCPRMDLGVRGPSNVEPSDHLLLEATLQFSEDATGKDEPCLEGHIKS